MLAKVLSFGVLGLEAYPIEIEVDVNAGLPAVTLVGLADTAIRESRERVKSAIRNSGFSWPQERVTISLAPSDIKKEGSSFDLAIALGILAATEQLECWRLAGYCILGELSLDGTVRPTKGTLPIGLAVAKSRRRKIIVPVKNAQEACLVPEIDIYPVKTLKETVHFLHQAETISPCKTDPQASLKKNSCYGVDFSEVKGQYFAKRGLEVAVSGGHNILMIGPPGSGKTMLAKRIPSIMPELSVKEALEITKIHSVAGTLPLEEGIMTKRPFRNPHHTASDVAMVGGGSLPQPGEITLAHHGVLFLDELPEFNHACLEALRQPLEDGSVRICRAAYSLCFPAAFMLVAAMNPCPCGRQYKHKNSCRCSTTQIARYRTKISGPLLDRIDIHIELPALRYQELSSDLPAESSAQIKEKVNQARAIQRERLKNEEILCNALMSHKQVRKFCVLGKDEAGLLKIAMSELNFSARAYDKILKIGRTIADLSGSEQIKSAHLAEAIQYRSLDRQW